MSTGVQKKGVGRTLVHPHVGAQHVAQPRTVSTPQIPRDSDKLYINLHDLGSF